MDHFRLDNRKKQLLMGIYNSSMGISLTALSIVAALEIFMLCFSFVDLALFGDLVWRYRAFYISLLSVAVVYIILYICVKKDVGTRHKWLNIANPICAIFFFAWSLGITWNDAAANHIIDSSVFMTFSLTVPLSFFLFPWVYAIIVVAADVVMLWITAVTVGYTGPFLNLAIFFIFQFVLGISYLRLQIRLADRILVEKENAAIDVMTGFANRRVYEEDLRKLTEEPIPDDLIYIAIDINGLKDVNDSLGHDTGDRLIIGAADCIRKSFSTVPTGRRMFRIGGDEFAVLLGAQPEEMDSLLTAYEGCMEAWSAENGIALTTSTGWISRTEHPEMSITELARAADRRMYQAKAQYYRTLGRDRRRLPDSD